MIYKFYIEFFFDDHKLAKMMKMMMVMVERERERNIIIII